MKIGKCGGGQSDHELVTVEWKGMCLREEKCSRKVRDERKQKKGEKFRKMNVGKARKNGWERLKKRGG